MCVMFSQWESAALDAVEVAYTAQEDGHALPVDSVAAATRRTKATIRIIEPIMAPSQVVSAKSWAARRCSLSGGAKRRYSLPMKADSAAVAVEMFLRAETES